MILKPSNKEQTKALLSSSPKKVDCCKLSSEHEGRLLIHVNEYTFETTLLKSNTPKLYVFLSAVGTSNAPYPIFHRVTWAKKFDGVCLYVDDPTRSLKNFFSPTFYFGSKDKDASRELLDIVKRIQVNFQIKNESVCFISSSNGGFAAIYIANMLPGSKCIALNPQIAIPYFAKNRNLPIANKLGISFDDRDIFGRIYLFHIVRNTSTKFFLYFNLACNFDREQYILLCKKNNIQEQNSPGLYKITSNIYVLLSSVKYLNNPHQVQLEESTCSYIDYLMQKQLICEEDPVFSLINDLTKKIFDQDAELKRKNK